MRREAESPAPGFAHVALSVHHVELARALTIEFVARVSTRARRIARARQHAKVVDGDGARVRLAVAVN